VPVVEVWRVEGVRQGVATQLGIRLWLWLRLPYRDRGRVLRVVLRGRGMRSERLGRAQRGIASAEGTSV